MEIERVFLLDGLPELPERAEALRIEQGYFPPVEQNDGTLSGPERHEGRLRRITFPDGSTQCVHTVKYGAGMIRHERERRISSEEFERHWPHTEPRRLTKTRYRVSEGPLTWEIDDFDQFDLVLAEVELADADQQVNLPDWLAGRVTREVTDDSKFLNYNLACRLAGESTWKPAGDSES